MVNIIIYFSEGKDKQKSEYDQDNAAFIVFWATTRSLDGYMFFSFFLFMTK